MTNIQFDKPFKTYDELLDLLESRNVIISDRETAKKLLSDFSYYYLINGFKNFFSVFPGTDSFEPAVLFYDFYSLLLAENEITSILLKYILFIERSLKSNISYRISEKYGVYTNFLIDDLSDPNDYLSNTHYRNDKSTDNVLKDIKYKIRNDYPRCLSAKYYVENHNHLPFWVAVNCLPLGRMITLFKILQPDDKLYVSTNMVHTSLLNDFEKKDFLYRGLSILRDYRNKIAHGERVYDSVIHDYLPKKVVLRLTNQAITNANYLNGIGKNDMFAVMLIITTLTRDLTHDMFINELSHALRFINKLSVANDKAINYFGLPDTTIEILLKVK